jgi:hypothetical protein
MFHSAKGEQYLCLILAGTRSDAWKRDLCLILLGSRSDAGERNICMSVCFQVDAELNTSATVFSLTYARSGPQSPESNKLCLLNWHWATMPPPASLQVRLITLAASFFCIATPCLPNVCFSFSHFHSLSFSFFLALLTSCI